MLLVRSLKHYFLQQSQTTGSIIFREKPLKKIEYVELDSFSEIEIAFL